MVEPHPSANATTFTWEGIVLNGVSTVTPAKKGSGVVPPPSLS